MYDWFRCWARPALEEHNTLKCSVVFSVKILMVYYTAYCCFKSVWFLPNVEIQYVFNAYSVVSLR